MSPKARPSAIRYVSSEIERMAEEAGVDDIVVTSAHQFYRDVLRTDYDPPSLDGLAVGCLAVSMQMNNEGGIRTVAPAARLDIDKIRTVAKHVSDEAGITLELVKPEDILLENTEELGVEEFSDELIQFINSVDGTYKSGHSPTALAAATIYAGSIFLDYDISQGAIEDEMNVSKVTIRNRYTELIEHSNFQPPDEERRFDTVEAALETFRDEIDLPDQAFDRAEALITLADRDLNANGLSEAGVALGAVLAGIDSSESIDANPDIETLTQYAAASKQCIRRHRETFNDD